MHTIAFGVDKQWDPAAGSLSLSLSLTHTHTHTHTGIHTGCRYTGIAIYLVTCDGTWWRIIREKEYMCIHVCICMCVCACVCVYEWLGYFAVQRKLIEHCKSTVIEKTKILKNIYIVKENRSVELTWNWPNSGIRDKAKTIFYTFKKLGRDMKT